LPRERVLRMWWPVRRIAPVDELALGVGADVTDTAAHHHATMTADPVWTLERDVADWPDVGPDAAGVLVASVPVLTVRAGTRSGYLWHISTGVAMCPACAVAGPTDKKDTTDE